MKWQSNKPLESSDGDDHNSSLFKMKVACNQTYSDEDALKCSNNDQNA